MFKLILILSFVVPSTAACHLHIFSITGLSVIATHTGTPPLVSTSL
jgi:hypothetical protein